MAHWICVDKGDPLLVELLRHIGLDRGQKDSMICYHSASVLNNPLLFLSTTKLRKEKKKQRPNDFSFFFFLFLVYVFVL